MQDMIQIYCENVVHPIEEARKELLEKIYSKSRFCILSRYRYKKLLKKYDELWMHSLKFVEEMLED